MKAIYFIPLLLLSGDHTISNDISVESYEVCHVITGGTSNLGPTAPSFDENDHCAGLAWDADNESIHLSFEVPSCYADGDSDDLTLKTYWCGENNQHPAQNEVVKFETSLRSIVWGTEDVDYNAAVAGSYIYTESADPGDEGDTHEGTITIDADHGDQPINAGDSLEIHFDRDWGVANNYPHDAITPKFEICLTQDKLICDHNN